MARSPRTAQAHCSQLRGLGLISLSFHPLLAVAEQLENALQKVPFARVHLNGINRMFGSYLLNHLVTIDDLHGDLSAEIWTFCV